MFIFSKFSRPWAYLSFGLQVWAGPGTCGPGQGLSSSLRARQIFAGPGQAWILIAGKAWAQIIGPCRALIPRYTTSALLAAGNFSY